MYHMIQSIRIRISNETSGGGGHAKLKICGARINWLNKTVLVKCVFAFHRMLVPNLSMLALSDDVAVPPLCSFLNYYHSILFSWINHLKD